MRIKNISTQSNQILTYFNQIDKNCFAYAEAVNALPRSSNSALKELLSDMIKRALLMLVKTGFYLIITFGILGTILMMVSERKRELGVMIAIGMQRARLATILFFETFFIGIIGASAGILVSIPITYWYHLNPIPLTGDSAKTMIAMGIDEQEAEYCYVEYVGYRILYPRYSIEPYYMSDPTVIYTVRDTLTNEKMMVAIRSCAIPAGI